MKTGDLIRYDGKIYIIGFIEETSTDCLMELPSGRVIMFSDPDLFEEVKFYGEVIGN